MKLIKAIAISSLLVLGLAGCELSSQDPNAFVIEQNYQNQDKTIITPTELGTKMTNDESFVVEIYSSTCTTCLEFDPILNAYIQSTQAVIYAIETGPDFMFANDYIPWSVVPTLAIVKDGEVWQKINASDNSSIFASLINFTDYINQYVRFGPSINISDVQLDQLITNDETFLVYYKRDTCSDCTFFDRNYLKSFRNDKEKANQKYYVFDMNEYYLNRTSSSDPYWLNFTAKYNLSDPAINTYGGSAEYGYKTGVVPTFQYYNAGELSDAVVIYNDSYTSIKDESNVTLSITITSSYFDDAPFIGTTYSATQDTAATNVYKIATLSYYAQKVEELFSLIY